MSPSEFMLLPSGSIARIDNYVDARQLFNIEGIELIAWTINADYWIFKRREIKGKQ